MTEIPTNPRDARYIEAHMALVDTIMDNSPRGVMLTPSQADALVQVLICGRFQAREPDNAAYVLAALSTSSALDDLVDALTGNEPVCAAVDPTYDTEAF